MKHERRIAVERASFRHKLICVAVASAFGSVAQANPTGPSVANGQVTFSQQGNTLAITNTPNAIINWRSFSIGATEATRFIQQSSSSAVLNRVTGMDPSVILGTLQSNGKVFLINPSGVLFGQGSRIDVAGLVASTLNLSDQDFLAGRLNFTAGSVTAGGISNQGTITTPSGGSVILVAPQIENSGIINAPNGDVILAAGRSVRLGDTGAPNVLVEIQAPDTQAVNVGQIVAAGGSASIYAGLIQQKGIVRADSAALDATGRIVFKSSKDVTLAAGSTTSASGASGGQITIQAQGGTTLVNGDVIATGSAGKGGDIQLLGTQVGVAGNATVNASGATGGGSILVGGDYRGANAGIQNADFTVLAPTASLLADATVAGGGGRIIVWSNEVTGANGAISARGGAGGGNGGFVETSSKGYLEVNSLPDLTAPRGTGGTWLIDPANIEITTATQFIQVINLGAATIFANDGANSPSKLNAATINSRLSGGISVNVDTGSALSEAGNITVNAPITMTAATSTTASLSLVADNSIIVNQPITATGSALLNLTLTPNRGLTGGSNSVSAPISTNGGNVVLDGNSTVLQSINTGGGSLTANGNASFYGGFDTGAGAFSSSGAVQLINPAYSVGGGFSVTGATTLGANATLTLNGSSNSTGSLVLDPNAGGFVKITGSGGGLSVAGDVTIVNAPSTAAGVAIVDGTGVSASGTTTLTGHVLQLANAGSFTTNNLLLTDAKIETIDSTATSLSVNNRFVDNGGSLFGGESSKINLGSPGGGSSVSITNSSFDISIKSPIQAGSVYLQTFEGSIVDGSGGSITNVTAGALNLYSSGDIGLPTAPLNTAAGALTAIAGSLSASGGTVNIANSGNVILNRLYSPAGTINLVNTGDISIPLNCPDGCVTNVATAGGTVYIESTTGSIDGGGSINASGNAFSGRPDGGQVTLKAFGSILMDAGTIGAHGDEYSYSYGVGNGGTVTLTAINGDVQFGTIDAYGHFGTYGAGGKGGVVDISAGGSVGISRIDVSGGGSSYYGSGHGGAGGTITISGNTGISVDTIYAFGGYGGDGSDGDAGHGGSGGIVTVNFTGGTGPIDIGYVDISGGNAGAGTNGVSNSGEHGGDAGQLLFNLLGGSGALTLGTVYAYGGNGGFNSYGGGGDGGKGGRVSVNDGGGFDITIAGIDAYGGSGANGRNGQAGVPGSSSFPDGGNGADGGDGGMAGAGGDIKFSAKSLIVGGYLSAYGGTGGSGGSGGAGGNGATALDGHGGNGGAGGLGGNGGAGGLAGTVKISAIDSISISSDGGLDVSGGQGGSGAAGGTGGAGASGDTALWLSTGHTGTAPSGFYGSSGSSGVGANGGDAGGVTIAVTGTNTPTIDISGFVYADGGRGGDANDIYSDGAGGTGGQGGSIVISGLGADLTISGTLEAIGGWGGSAHGTGGGAGRGGLIDIGNGGLAPVSNVTIDGTLAVVGGTGGDSQFGGSSGGDGGSAGTVRIDATGVVTFNGYIEAGNGEYIDSNYWGSGQGGAGYVPGAGGQGGSVFIKADAGIAITSSAVIDVTGGRGGNNNSEGGAGGLGSAGGQIALTSSAGSIVVDGALIADGVGSGNGYADPTVKAGGGGAISLDSALGVNVSGNISVRGGDQSYSSNGGSGGDGGFIDLRASDPAGGISLSGSLDASGGNAGNYGNDGAAGGKGGTVRLIHSAGGAIDVSGSIYASGGNGGLGYNVGGVGGEGGLINISSSAPGGSISLTGITYAAGSAGGASYYGTGGAGGHGGNVNVGADGDVLLGGEVHVSGGTGGSNNYGGGDGGNGGSGGGIAVSSGGAITVSGYLDAGHDNFASLGGGFGDNGGSGNTGGTIALNAVNGITVTSSAVLDVTGGYGGNGTFNGGNAGDSGSVMLTTTGPNANIQLDGRIISWTGDGGSIQLGSGDTPGNGGRGGTITLSASGDVIAGATSVISASGGTGGYTNNSDGITVPGAVGINGAGGTVSISGNNVSLGGVVVANAGFDAQIAGQLGSGGDGGSISVNASQLASLSGTFDVTGAGVSINDSRTDVAGGSGGSIQITAGGDITFSGATSFKAAAGASTGTPEALPGAGTVILASAAGSVTQNASSPVNISVGSDFVLDVAGNAILDNLGNVIPALRGNVGGDLIVTTFSPLQLGNGNLNSVTVGGNLIARSEAGSGITFPDACSGSGDSCIAIPNGVNAGGNIEFYSDKIDDHGAIVSGSLASNYVRFAPWSPGQDLSLDIVDTTNYVTPHLQVGDPAALTDSTLVTWNSVTIPAGSSVQAGNFNGTNQSFDIYAGQVTIDGQIGNISPLNVSFGAHATGAINVGTTTFASIVLGDNRTLQLDAGLSGTGDLTIGGGPGLTIRVGESSGNTGSMILGGANINVIAAGGSSGTEVQVLGTGSQTIATPGLLNVSSLGAGGGIWLSGGTQFISAGAIKVGAANGSNVNVHAADAQTINVDQSGYTGTPVTYGIEVVNNGGGEAGINTEGAQTISVMNSGGLLVDAVGGNANIRGGGYWSDTGFIVNGGQTILIDGAGANQLILRGGAGTASIEGGRQSITAGTGGNAGSIQLTGSASNFGSAEIFADAGTQTIATTGQINVVAGSAPDIGQGAFNCGGGGACALIGNLSSGGDQFITAGQGILIQGGMGGALNEAAVFGNGNQTVNANAISVIGGTAPGSGNYASLSANASGFAQAINFGAGGIDIESGTQGDRNNAGIYSGGNQIIAGSGDIVLKGGVPGLQSWAEISTYAGNGPAAIQAITARSISITATSGPTSTGIFTPTGSQQISTTGSAANGYGISIVNTGSTGTDQNGFNSAAYIATRADSQSIDVANSNGILISGIGGEAGIYSNAGSQTVNIHGTGQNKLVIAGGLGQGQLNANGTQTVTAGASGEAGGITVSGGSVAGAHGWFYTNGDQIINTPGDIVLTGGNGNRTFIFGNNSGNVNGVQQITANSISITAVSGAESTGIFTPAGSQHIHTTGTAGNGYGITIENVGATGVDEAGFGTAAFLTTRTGTQLIDVDQGGILVKGTGGVAVIDAEGAFQTINIASGSLDLQAGTGAASVYFASGSSQSITADSISLVGGSQNTALAIIHADNGTQTITTTSGLLSLKGGTAPGSPTASPDVPPADCGATSACAVVLSRNGLQTINAYGIEVIGGGGVSENLATIRGDAGQTFNVGAGGLTMKGGNGSGVHNYAFIENYGGDQILNFATGSFLDIKGGDIGVRNFAGIWGGGSITYDYTVLGNTPFAEVFTRTTSGTASQQILGNPVITVAGGVTGGGGNGLEGPLLKRGNTGFILAQTGSQQIDAASITLAGGGGNGENLVSIATLESGASQTINATGVISLAGGSALYAGVDITSAGTQTIHAGGISLLGGSASGLDSSDNPAGNAPALITANGGTQSIVISGGGSIALTGGTNSSAADPNSNSAVISSADGFNQSIQFLVGGAIALTGGSSGAFNSARIDSGHNQTISGAPSVTIAGGAGASSEAGIDANHGNVQTLTFNSLALKGGTGDMAIATVGGGTNQSVTVTGATTLIGGTGNGALAAIGTDRNDIAINLATGSLSLQAGTGDAGADGIAAIAAIGAVFSTKHPSPLPNATVIITTSTGDVTLNGATSSTSQPVLALIGTDPAAGAGGAVSVTAAGNITEGSNALIRGSSVMLSAGADIVLGTVTADSGAISATAGTLGAGSLDLTAGILSATSAISLSAPTEVSVASTTSFATGTGVVNLTTPELFLSTDFTLPTSGAHFTFLTPGMSFVGATPTKTLTNLGSLTLNGNSIDAVFDNQGTVDVASGNVVLHNGGGGSYTVASGAALGFASGSYTVASISGPGGVNVSGGNVDVTDYAVGGTTNLSAGSLAIGGTGTLGTLNVTGGSFAGAGNVTAAVLNLGGGSLDGTCNLTVSSNFTQSGGTVGGFYQTLSLRHIGDFAVGNFDAANSLVLTAAGGSLLINGVSLDAPTVSLKGDNIHLQPAADTSSLVDSVNLNISTPGALLIDGSNGPAKLLASGTMNISAGSVTVKAGSSSASIDPVTLNLNVAGDLVIQGGATSSAIAIVAADSINIAASNITIQGGSGDGSYAGIVGGPGQSTVKALNSISLVPGIGLDADAVVGSTGAGLTVTAANCVGCTMLPANPLGNQAIDGGLFGAPVNLVLPPSQGSGLPLIEVDNSIIYAATLAQSGGTANTSYTDDEEDKDKGVKEEGNNGGKSKRNLPNCM